MAQITLPKTLPVITARHNGKIQLILPEEIYYIKACGKNVLLFVADPLGQLPFRVLTDGKNIGQYAFLLQQGFVAASRSYMVNCRKILDINDKSIRLRCPFEHEPIIFSKPCYRAFLALT